MTPRTKLSNHTVRESPGDLLGLWLVCVGSAVMLWTTLKQLVHKTTLEHGPTWEPQGIVMKGFDSRALLPAVSYGAGQCLMQNCSRKKETHKGHVYEGNKWVLQPFTWLFTEKQHWGNTEKELLPSLLGFWSHRSWFSTCFILYFQKSLEMYVFFLGEMEIYPALWFCFS